MPYYQGSPHIVISAPRPMRPGLLLAAVALALLPLAAPLMAARFPLTAMLIRAFFSRLCHQNPSRSFFLEGSQAAVCVRCLGIYCGAALACLGVYRLRAAQRWLAIALAMNVLDVVTELLRWHGNLPLLRFPLGFLIGAACGALLLQPDHHRLRKLWQAGEKDTNGRARLQRLRKMRRTEK